MFGRKKWKLSDFIVEDGVAVGMTEKACRKVENTKVFSIPEGIKEFDIYMGGLPIEILHLPKSLKRIGERAFEDCSLKSIIGGDNVEEIERKAFKNNQLESVLGFKKLEIIGEEAFCQNRISEFFFSKRLKEIRRGAFKDNKLESIDLQTSRNVIISDYAFHNNMLEDIQINPISKVDETSFSFNPLKKLLTKKAEKDNNWTEDDFYICGNELTGIAESGMEKIKRTNSMTIPPISGVTCISFDKPIYDSLPEELEYVYICDGIEKINENVFDKSNIKHIRFPKTLKVMIDGTFRNSSLILVDLSKTQLTKINANVFSGCDSLKEVKLPRTLTRIGYLAFDGTKSLKEIIIPSKVEYIMDEAFFNSGVTKVNFENNSHLKYIGMRAFENSAVREVNWSKLKNLEEIGNYAFNMTRIQKPKKILRKVDTANTAFSYYNSRKLGDSSSLFKRLFKNA